MKYGTTVSECAPEIRNAFIRKVYSILRKRPPTHDVSSEFTQTASLVSQIVGLTSFPISRHSTNGRIVRYLHSRRHHLAVTINHILGTNAVRRISSPLNGVLAQILLLLISTWAFYVPLFGTLINLGILYWKRHTHPLNYVLLSSFTLMEAFTLGVVVAFYDNVIVLQAL